MSHFAKVIDGVVTEVIVAEQDYIDAQPDSSIWIQTSYNTRGGKHYNPLTGEEEGVALRKNYAGIGYTYDETRDAFIAQQPFPSWLLDEDTCQWYTSTPMPDDDKLYKWDEDTISWEEIILPWKK